MCNEILIGPHEKHVHIREEYVEIYIFYGTFFLGLYIEYVQNFGAISRCIWDANEEEGVPREVLEG
jgi:hypothetical protein